MAVDLHEYAYFEGDFVKAEEAKINVMTHAFMYGTSVFEGIRAYWCPKKEKLYLLKAKEHFERLISSCKILRIKPTMNLEQMIDTTIALLKKNRPESDTYIRPVCYKSALRIGPTLLNASSSEKDDEFLITTIGLGDYVDTSKGLSVCISNWRRLSDNAIPARAKVGGSYVNTAMAKSDASLAGFDEAIFLTETGKVAEGSAMNLFIVRNGQLITPAITENILEGITRKTIAEIAQDLGIEVVSRQVDRTELYVADEAFFVGTGAQVAPIVKIDNYPVSDAKPGPITNQLKDKYFSICRGDEPKYKDAILEIDYSKAAA